MSTKSDVLAFLEENRAAPITGTELAGKLGVSRAAIWKAVKSLQEDGHTILAAPNRGYSLSAESDILSAEGIRLWLSKELCGNAVIVYKTIDSTNAQAKRMAVDGAPNGMLVISETQTSGRGRFGRSFYSPPLSGIYMSLILHPQTDAADSDLVTIRAAVAVCRAIERLTNLHPQIKWVNDIFLGGKKICGILTEAITSFESRQIETVIVGIGLNCSTKKSDFPKELRSIAGSLSLPGLPRNRLAAEIVNEFFACASLPGNAVLAEYKNRSLLLGKEIRYEKDGAECTGMVLDINERGNLVVQTPSGAPDILFSGEVSVRSKSHGS